MPTINISQPFNFRSGLDVKRYKAGKQHVSETVAAHAEQHGFINVGDGGASVTGAVYDHRIEEAQDASRNKKAP